MEDKYKFGIDMKEYSDIMVQRDDLHKRIGKFKESPVFYIDFDNTLLNTVQVYCETYNEFYSGDADWTRSKTWNLEDECPPWNPSMVDDIFDTDMWEFMGNYTRRYYYDRAVEFVDYAVKVGKAYIVTVGTDSNIIRKAQFIDNTLNKELGKLYIVKKEAFNLKAKIDMSDGIVIDDRTDILYDSNALYKIRFGEDFEWNSNWTPNNITTFTCRTWDEVFELVKKLRK